MYFILWLIFSLLIVSFVMKEVFAVVMGKQRDFKFSTIACLFVYDNEKDVTLNVSS